MKFSSPLSTARRQAGILLLECVVYIAVFAVLLGVGTASFYYCWDHTKAVMQATDDITSALRAGERWRADVRSATGKISTETTPGGELLRIPHRKDEIFYSYHDGTIWRKLASANFSERVLAKVKTSQMETELRSGVTAWRWELELKERRKETHLPLQFTFEAAQPVKP